MAFDAVLPRVQQTIAEIVESTRSNLVALYNLLTGHAAAEDAHNIAPLRAGLTAYNAHAADQDAHGVGTVRTGLATAVAEVTGARGSQSTLAARLSAGLNSDGTVRLSTLASKWIAPGDVPTYVSTTSFSVPTDRRGVYIAGAILRLVVSGQQVYAPVASSAFAAGNTTVTIDPAYPVLTAGLASVELALIAFDNTLASALAAEQAARVPLEAKVAALSVEIITASKTGKPAASEVMLRYVASRALTLPIGATGSLARAGTAATASATLSLRVNGTAVGSINFAAGQAAGTYAIATAVACSVGDVITLVAPAGVDATLADLTFALKGVLQ